MINKEIGDRFRKIRNENNYSQRQIADYLDVESSLISRIENGEGSIDTLLVYRLCDLYNCPIEYFEGEDVEYHQPNMRFKNKSTVDDLKVIARMNKISNIIRFLRVIEDEKTIQSKK